MKMDHKVGELADSLAAAAQDARSLDRQVSFVRAPVATRKWVDRLYTWATNRQRLVMGLLPGMVGIYLLVTGISKL